MREPPGARWQQWDRPAPMVAARAVVVPYVIARLLVAGALGLTRHVVDHLDVATRPVQIHQGLLAWDAAWYRDIAQGGYDAVGVTGLRFFPLVPLLARSVALVPGVSASLALVLVANASALALGFAVYALVGQERHDDELARRAVWLTALAPPAFILVMGYAEATMMLLAVLAFIALRSHRWWWATLAGFGAGMARPVGLLLVVPAAIEVLAARRPLGAPDFTWRNWVPRVAAVAGPVVGLFTYLTWANDRGNGLLYPLRSQEDPTRRGDWQAPWTTIGNAARDLGSDDRFGSGLHLFTVVLLAALLVVLARRWPLSYTGYAAAAFVLALTASNLDSLERYGLSAFPFLLAAADVADSPARERALFALAGGALVAMSVLAFSGVLVP